MRRIVCPLAAAVIALPAAAQTRDFQIEAAHSDISFAIGFLRFPVRGRFDDVRGTLAYDARDLTQSSISIAIPVKGLSTGSAHRDEHLRSSDFFDAEKYPYIVFQSTRVTRAANGFAAAGTLAMHGVTREIVIPFHQVGTQMEEPHGSSLLFFSGSVRLDRRDFGIMGGATFNPWFDAVRSASMADSVDITLDVEAWDPDYTRSTTYDRVITKIAAVGTDSVLAPFRRMVAQSPDTLKDADWDFSQLGAALLTRGKPREALQVLTFGAAAIPRSSRMLAALAHAQEVAGDKAAARATARRALDTDPYNTWAMEIARRVR
ncbi:MAG TPA: YceI family protein [Gemmatimonadaceae bacterium]|nr:YceI family protein [Gemmatimonadaceae bacterium]